MYISLVINLLLLTGCAGAAMVVEEVAEEVIEETAKEVIKYEENKHKNKVQE